MSTPYVTSALLRQADTGVDWGSLVEGHLDDDVTLAEITNICYRVSEMCDSFCNQVLRSTIDSEQFSVPSFRAAVLSSGVCRIILTRWPVTYVHSIQVSPTMFPPSYAVVDPSRYFIENLSLDTASGTGAYGVLISSGYVDQVWGSSGYQLIISYVNGWPNSSLTSDVAEGAVTLNVDDTTGFLPGARFTFFDGAYTEQAVVASASTDSGPGTLTLALSLTYEHILGTLVSGMPSSVQQACIYLATYVALTRGATAIAMPPARGVSGSGNSPDDFLVKEANRLLTPYKRII